MTEQNVYSLIADVALFVGGQVLFVKYSNPDDYDGQTGWFLPDASIKYLEHPEKAAARILKDQLGLEKTPLVLNHIESFRGNNATWHLSFHYRTDLTEKPQLKPTASIDAAEWFLLTALPSKDEIAHQGWGLNTLKKMLSAQEN